MSRRPPPNVFERREYVVANGFMPFHTRVVVTDLRLPGGKEVTAVVVGITDQFMVRIKYEDPEAARLYGKFGFKLLNPTRLRLA